MILINSSRKNDEKATGLAGDRNPYFGMFCALICAIFSSGVGVITRKLKHIHVSLMLFHYGWTASLGYFIMALINDLKDGRKPLSYDLQ